MAYLDDLYKLREEHTGRLQGREIQQATLGDLADPSIPIEIKRIRNELAAMESQISAHSELLDLFRQYENGFDHLLERLGQNRRRAQALEYQARMSAHIAHVREAGDMPEGPAERERMLDQVSQIAIQTLDISFNRLMRLPSRGNACRPSASSSPPPRPTPPSGAGHPTISSIQNQNIVTGDHNIVFNAGFRNIYNQPAEQSDGYGALEQRIAAIEQAIVSSTPVPLRQQALGYARGLRQAISAADIGYLRETLEWFERSVPALAEPVRAIILHPRAARIISTAGPMVYSEYRRRFAKPNGGEEP